MVFGTVLGTVIFHECSFDQISELAIVDRHSNFITDRRQSLSLFDPKEKGQTPLFAGFLSFLISLLQSRLY
ncbi:hypothetical protein ALT716_40060 [Alteromonas macleodii]